MSHISEELTDKEILVELGKRIQTLRIEENITQAKFADISGVSLNTVARMEQGTPIKTDNLLAILRILGLLENLNLTIPDREFHPMDVISKKNVQKKRERASTPTNRTQKKEWKWGDEK